jgi:hypothetical protein
LKATSTWIRLANYGIILLTDTLRLAIVKERGGTPTAFSVFYISFGETNTVVVIMSRKYTYEEVKEYFSNENCRLLSTDYKNNATLLDYVCKCGKQSKISFANFRKGVRCKECGIDKLKQSISHNYDYIYNFFKDNSCTLLEKEYNNNRQKLKYICVCSNIAIISFSEFQQGKRCKKCANEKLAKIKRLSFDYVKKFFEKYESTLLDTNYKNNSSKLLFKCRCGNVSNTTFHTFQSTKRCKKCGMESLRLQAIKYSIECMKKLFEKGGCTLLDDIFEHVDRPMRFICECGETSRISYTNFKKGKRCKKCGIEKSKETKRNDTDYVRSVFTDNGCKLLDEYRNEQTPLKYVCKCGRQSLTRFVNFKKSGCCRICSFEKLRGENSPQWNPNLTDEERIQKRDYREYIHWRNGVFQRDEYTCQCCGKTQCILNAHHIEGYARNKKLRTEITNGITLCYECHREFHTIHGWRDNNIAQLNEFLKTKAIRKSS